YSVLFCMPRRPPVSTLFPYTTLFRSKALLQNLLRRAEVLANDVDTRFVERHLGELLHAGEHPSRVAQHAVTGNRQAVTTPEGCEALTAHSAGVLVSLLVTEGDAVAAGQPLAVLEAMKMEFELRAPCAGLIHSIVLGEGATLAEGQALLFVSPGEGAGEHQVSEE